MLEIAQRILLVEDDQRLAEATSRVLRRVGFAVAHAPDGGSALRECETRLPDLMLLDISLPDFDGLQVLEYLQIRYPDAFPILVLTGTRVGTSDEVLGLERGATDYMVKGLDDQVLLARIRRAIRERVQSKQRLIRGALSIEASGHATLGGRTLDLDRRQVEVLYYLAERPHEVVPRRDLLRQIWGSDFQGYDHAIEQNIYAIRKKIGREWITTIHGIGYMFTTPHEDQS